MVAVAVRRCAPLSVGETLDVALKLYRRNAVALWTIVASVIIPLEIIDIIVRRVTLPSDVFVHNGQLYTFTSGGSSGTSGTVALLLISLLGLFGQLLAHGATFKLLLDSYLGRTHRRQPVVRVREPPPAVAAVALDHRDRPDRDRLHPDRPSGDLAARLILGGGSGADARGLAWVGRTLALDEPRPGPLVGDVRTACSPCYSCMSSR